MRPFEGIARMSDAAAMSQRSGGDARSQHALSADGTADGRDLFGGAQRAQQRVVAAATRNLHLAFLVARPKLEHEAGVVFHVAAEARREGNPLLWQAEFRERLDARLHLLERRIERDAVFLQKCPDGADTLRRRS